MHDWLEIRPFPATSCDGIGGRRGWLARLSVHLHGPSHMHDMQILRFISTNVCMSMEWECWVGVDITS